MTTEEQGQNSTIAIVILAAGRSKRFENGQKLLAMIDGQPLIRRTVDTAELSSAKSIIVVTGADHARIVEALGETRAIVSCCSGAESGMAASIAHGVTKVANDAAGLAIIPGDMPALTAGFLNRLLDVFRSSDGRQIVYAANSRGEQRNPVIWPRRYVDKLVNLEGFGGAKSLFAAEQQSAIAVRADSDDELQDVDTTEDLTQMSSRLALRPRERS